MDEMMLINFIKNNINEYDIEAIYKQYIIQEDLMCDKIREWYKLGIIDEDCAVMMLSNCEYFKFMIFNYMFGNCERRA